MGQVDARQRERQSLRSAHRWLRAFINISQAARQVILACHRDAEVALLDLS
jgi:hypothetical protein